MKRGKELMSSKEEQRRQKTPKGGYPEREAVNPSKAKGVPSFSTTRVVARPHEGEYRRTLRFEVFHEPPYTDRYVWWCGRTRASRPLLPDRMKKESHIKIRPIFLFPIVLTLFLSFSIKVRSEKRQYFSNLSGAQKFILLIVDYQSLFCPLCLEIFQDFCDLLHSSGQEAYASGVLVYKDTDNDGDNERIEKIIEKQLKGLIIGSNIRFPFLYDKFHILERLDVERATIILFDRSRKLLKKYTLPLTLQQKEEVFSF